MDRFQKTVKKFLPFVLLTLAIASLFFLSSCGGKNAENTTDECVTVVLRRDGFADKVFSVQKGDTISAEVTLLNEENENGYFWKWSSDVSVPLYEDKTFFGTLTAIAYSLEYKGSGFDFSSLPVAFTVEDLPLTLSIPSGTGSFAGWFSDPTFQNPIFEITELQNTVVYAKPAEEKQVFRFETVSGTKTLTLAEYTGNDENVTVPSEWEGWKVVGIEENVFKDCVSLVSVTLPESLKFIGNRAFSGCIALREINLEKTKLETLGTFAFENCISLTDAVLPGSVTVIGRGAFAGTRLHSITIPFTGGSTTSGKTHLGYIFGATVNGREAAQYLPTELTSVSFTLSCTEVREDAFLGCSQLTEIVLSPLTQKIGNNAFAGCTGLTTIRLPQKIKSIPASVSPGYSPFWGCSDQLTVILEKEGQDDGYGTCWNCISETTRAKTKVEE